MTQSISMINLRKLLTCKVLCYSKMWSSRFHVSWRTASPERAAVQRKKHELKALGPDRLLSTTENLSHLEGAESFRYPWNLESMYEELKIDDSFCSGKRACYSRRAATPGYLRTWNSHRSWEANSCIRVSFGSSTCVVDCTFFPCEKNKTSYLEISSYYCLHRIYFHSSLLHVPLDRLEHVCGLLIYIFLFLRHVSLCLCPLLTVIFAWRFEHTWIVNARFSSNMLRWICTNHFTTSPFIYYYWKPWMCSRVYSGTIAERVLLRITVLASVLKHSTFYWSSRMESCLII